MAAYSPTVMVSPAGAEVTVHTKLEANNLACRGYRAKIVSKPVAPTAATAVAPSGEPVGEGADSKTVAKPARVTK